MRGLGIARGVRTIGPVAIAALLAGSSLLPPGPPPANALPAPPDAPPPAMDAILASDGSLALPPDFHGSIDPRGWSMAIGDDGRPRFSRDSGSRPVAPDGASGPSGVTGSALGDDSNWDPRFRGDGPDFDVRALAVDGTTVYLGGDFLTAGPVVANHVVRYDSLTGAFTPLGSGLDGDVFALAFADGKLYIGGRFSAACANAQCTTKLPANGINRIAVWDGSSFSPLGNGFNLDVLAIAVASNGVYAGGGFNQLCANADCSAVVPANGVNKVAFYNGATWVPLGKGLNGIVFAAAIVGSIPYFGGNFDRACSNDTCGAALPAAGLNNIAAFNGGNFQPLDNGLNNVVFALAVSGISLVVGGNFTRTCSNPACAPDPPSGVNRIALYVGGSWVPVDAGLNAVVRGLAVSGSTIYAIGDFTRSCATGSLNCAVLAPANGLNRVGSFNGSAWSPMSFGLKTEVVQFANTVAVAGNRVVAGGSFHTKCADVDCTFGNVGTENAAIFAGGSWSGLFQTSNSTNGPVEALLVNGDDIYVAGLFFTVQGNRANNIAKYTPATNTWTRLDRGLNGIVRALAMSGTKVIAGGNFDRVCSASDCSTTVAANGVNHVVVWDGTSWAPLGQGLNDAVYALAVIGTSVYAGGNFTKRCTAMDCGTSTQTGVNYVARFDGTNWVPLVDGLAFPVYALATDGAKLFAGGSFRQICSNPVCTTLGPPNSGYNRVAVFNGSGWAPLANGLSDTVYSLAVSGATVYAGGQFSRSCSNGDCTTVDPAAGLNNVAMYNGTAWVALGQGVNDRVYSLALSGSTLYLGGDFTADCANAACSAPGPTGLQRIGRFANNAYSPLGSGLSSSPRALVFRSGDLYVGGSFSIAGVKPSVYFARWGESADLSVAMTASASPINTGITMTFTSTVTNLGPATAMSVTVQNTLPAGADFVSASTSAGTCPAAPPILCTIGYLEPGASATIVVQAVARAGGPNTDTAVAATIQSDAPPDNNTATATITVIGAIFVPASPFGTNATG